MDVPMPKRFSTEFRDDVVRVARSGKLTHEEIAHNFNISLSSLTRWFHQADVDDGLKGGLASNEQDEVVQLPRDNRRQLQGVSATLGAVYPAIAYGQCALTTARY